MAQLVARLDDGLMAEVDRLVADGVVANRSEAVRLGLERLVDQKQRQRVGAAIVDGYRRQPQTDLRRGCISPIGPTAGVLHG
jgi:Arc/MetJ-type ribon-helix-helix transcriptional regulator